MTISSSPSSPAPNSPTHHQLDSATTTPTSPSTSLSPYNETRAPSMLDEEPQPQQQQEQEGQDHAEEIINNRTNHGDNRDTTFSSAAVASRSSTSSRSKSIPFDGELVQSVGSLSQLVEHMESSSSSPARPRLCDVDSTQNNNDNEEFLKQFQEQISSVTGSRMKTKRGNVDDDDDHVEAIATTTTTSADSSLVASRESSREMPLLKMLLSSHSNGDEKDNDKKGDVMKSSLGSHDDQQQLHQQHDEDEEEEYIEIEVEEEIEEEEELEEDYDDDQTRINANSGGFTLLSSNTENDDILDDSGTQHQHNQHQQQSPHDRFLRRNIFFEEGVDDQRVANPIMHYLHVGCWYTKACDYYQHRRPHEGEVKGQAVMWLHNARPRDRFVFLVSNVRSGWPEGSFADELKQAVYGYAPRFALDGRKQRPDEKVLLSGRPLGVEVIEILHSEITAVDFSPGLVSSRFALECSEVTCIWFPSEYAAREAYCCPISRPLDPKDDQMRKTLGLQSSETLLEIRAEHDEEDRLRFLREYENDNDDGYDSASAVTSSSTDQNTGRRRRHQKSASTSSKNKNPFLLFDYQKEKQRTSRNQDDDDDVASNLSGMTPLPPSAAAAIPHSSSETKRKRNSSSSATTTTTTSSSAPKTKNKIQKTTPSKKVEEKDPSSPSTRAELITERNVSMQWAKQEMSSSMWNSSSAISPSRGGVDDDEHDDGETGSVATTSSAATTSTSRQNQHHHDHHHHSRSHSASTSTNNNKNSSSYYHVGAITPPLNAKYPTTAEEAAARAASRDKKYFTHNHRSSNSSSQTTSRTNSFAAVRRRSSTPPPTRNKHSSPPFSSSPKATNMINNNKNISRGVSPAAASTSSSSSPLTSSSSSINHQKQQQKHQQPHYLMDTESRSIHNAMIVGFTQDPNFQAVIRELVLPGGSPTNEGLGSHVFTQSVAERQRLLRLVEAGIPSWALFCTRYGIFYHRYLRVVMSAAINIWPLIALGLGLYDLYSHMPYVHKYLVPFFELFEDSWIFRLSLGVAYVFSYFLYFFQWLAGTFYFVGVFFTSLLMPLAPAVELMYPLYSFFKLLFVGGATFIFNFFSMTFGSLGTVIFGLLKTLFYPVTLVLSAAPTTTATASSVSTLPQYFTWLIVLWKTVLRPVKNLIKAIYDGVVHVGSVIARHEASLRMWYMRKFRRLQRFVVSHGQEYWRTYFQLFMVVIVVLYLPSLVGMLFGVEEVGVEGFSSSASVSSPQQQSSSIEN